MNGGLTIGQRGKVAKAWGKAYGFYGKQGGWICNQHGYAICQGWYMLYEPNRHAIRAWLFQSITPPETFDEQVNRKLGAKIPR